MKNFVGKSVYDINKYNENLSIFSKIHYSYYNIFIPNQL